MSLEYTHRNIRFNAICHGIIETPMVAGVMANEGDAMRDLMKEVPIGRLGQPQEIADAVLWISLDMHF